nr:amino acid transporter [Microbacterium amylolyticum]
MKPIQLLGVAFASALFAGFVAVMSMGGFTGAGSEVVTSAWRVGGILAGIVFIAVLLGLALLLLVVDPRDVVTPTDKPILTQHEDDVDDGADGDAPGENRTE